MGCKTVAIVPALSFVVAESRDLILFCGKSRVKLLKIESENKSIMNVNSNQVPWEYRYAFDIGS